jgi:hypothetical protein
MDSAEKQAGPNRCGVSCVVDKINEFRNVVGDKSKPIEARRFALRFLLHCVQDLHQPCHVGDNRDKGGNLTQVRWFDQGSKTRISRWYGGDFARPE